MSATIQPVGAWCPVDETGALQIQYLQYFAHHIMLPAGKERAWRIVRVVIDPMVSWEERDEAARALSDLPDAVAAVMLGGQDDVRPKLPPPCGPLKDRPQPPPPPPPPPGSLAEMLAGQRDDWAEEEQQ